MGTEGPLRCSKCKAYVNPFMQFHSYGKAFTCNFCSTVTQVPPDYQENIGHDGRRRDADERPELCRGSVEFVAPSSFQAIPDPQPAKIPFSYALVAWMMLMLVRIQSKSRKPLPPYCKSVRAFREALLPLMQNASGSSCILAFAFPLRSPIC